MFSLYAVVEKNSKTPSRNFTQVVKFLFGFEGVGVAFLLKSICAETLWLICIPV